MLKIKTFFWAILVCLAVAAFWPVRPVLAEDRHPTTIYFFWGDGCPHCAQEKPFLERLEDTYPELEIKSYEVWYNRENSKLFAEMSRAYGSEVGGVPTTFVGDFAPTVGFGTASTTGKEIEERVIYCLKNGCLDPGSTLGPEASVQLVLLRSDSVLEDRSASEERITSLPLVGEVDVSKTGLLVFTVLIGILDGFNACAMWVLLFLLSLLVHSQSRKRMLLVGGTFIAVSGLMYYLFIAGWMSLFIFAGSLRVIQVSIGILAIVFGLVNIKDFFWFGKGLSFVIPAAAKKKIIKRMQKLTRPGVQLAGALGGVAILAVGVNVVELLCSLGLPAVYTAVLNTYNYPPLLNYLYLLVYVFFYMLDDLLIFSVVVMTMSHRKFTEKYGRLSKLISGLVILVLGLIMILNPKLLMFG